MKKSLLGICLFAICALTHAATIAPPKWDANTQDKALIQSYIDWCKANNVKEVSYVGFMSKVLLATADFDSKAQYADIKAAVKASLPANASTTTLQNSVYSVLKNVKRLGTPSNVKAYVADLQKTEKSLWAKSKVFSLKGMTPEQRIWAFETGIEVTKKPSIALANLNDFIKVSKDYNANYVLTVAKSLKRKIYSRITDEEWKPVLVKLELLIQSLQ